MILKNNISFPHNLPKESFIYSFLYPKIPKFDSKGIEIKMGFRIQREIRMTGR